MKKWMLIVVAACGSASEQKSVTPPVVASAPRPVTPVAIVDAGAAPKHPEMVCAVPDHPRQIPIAP